MQGIPPVKDTDAEDVAWGLQTAEALWKRGERGDALVWLRRAAQAAGDANDDDRALELARFAAELTEWMTANAPSALPTATQPPSRPPEMSQAPAAPQPPMVVSAASPMPIPPPPAFLGPIPTDLSPSRPPPAAKPSKPPLPRPLHSRPPAHVPAAPAPSAPPAPAPSAPPAPAPSAPPAPAHVPAAPAFPPPEQARPAPPSAAPPSQPTMETAEPAFPPEEPSEPEEPQTTSVPPAERVHAGMFNPWDENAGAQSQPAVPVAPVVAPRFAEEEDEVITSASLAALRKSTAPSRPEAPSSQRPEPPRARPPSDPPVRATPPAAPKPPPLPPRAKKPAPPLAAAQAPAPPVDASPAPAPVDVAPAPVDAAPAPAPVDAAPAPAPAPVDVAPAPAAEPRAPSRPPRMTPPPPSPTQVTTIADRATREDDEAPAMEETPIVDIPPVRPTVESEPPPSRPEVAAAPAPPAPEEPAAAPEEAAAAPEEAAAAPEEAAAAPEEAAAAPEDPAAEPPPAADQPAASALDLENVDAFADLPDDARAAFAAAATVSHLAEGEEVSHFALAYVLTGALDVAATMVDAPASRLETGAVLRSRGSTDEGVPMRLICAGGDAVVATWSDAAVEEAFRTCPWVEEDLRSAADKVQTLVGITIGPLGERLDASIREQIVGRLTMRPLSAGEVIVKQGDPVPGLFLVGVGEIELVEGDAVKSTVTSGDFLFAGTVLGGGLAPSTARAGAGGALVLHGDRNIAQELLVTCPPLLEVFAGM
jgi:hypothetical protein